MKTRISTVAVALFFAFLLVGNVNANEHKGDASSHENKQEAMLEFENWMTDAEVWNTPTNVMFTEVKEANLEFENWMTNEIIWEVELGTLQIEDWMLNESIWEVENHFAYNDEVEKPLQVERWMNSKNIW